jgi:hypothetical protein
MLVMVVEVKLGPLLVVAEDTVVYDDDDNDDDERFEVWAFNHS